MCKVFRLQGEKFSSLLIGFYMPPLGCMNTEAEGHRALVQHGVLPCLVGGEWRGRCDLYCDGRSEPPALADRTACPDGPYRLPWVTVPPALTDRTACPEWPYRLPWRTVPPALSGAAQLRTSGNSSCWCCWYITEHVYNRSSSPKSHIAGRVIFLVNPCLLPVYEFPYSSLGW